MKRAKHLRHQRPPPALRLAPPRPARTEPGLRQRARYRFDATLARGTWAVVAWLGALTGAVVVVAGLLLLVLRRTFTPEADAGFREGLWQSMLRVLDPGTMAGDEGWGARLLALTLTVVGLLLASALIGLVAAAIDQRIAELRKGRSFVVEEGHVLVAGWSPRVFTVVAELQTANENRPGSCIVVLSDLDTTEMDDELRARVPLHPSTRRVCRTGDPASLADLAMVNAAAVRSVVVLGDEQRGGDAEVVKATLAVLASDVGDRVPIVAEVLDPDTASALVDASAGRVQPVRSADVIARVTAQACREAGLSTVFQELLDFEGDEVYFAAAPELEGHTFGEALLAYDTSSVFGRRTAAGEVQLCPPVDTVFEAGDEVVAVSADDDQVVFTGFCDVPAPEAPGDAVEPVAEHLLVIGWNDLGPMVLRQLDHFVLPGSTVDVLHEPELVGRHALAERAEVETEDLAHLTVAFHEARTDVASLQRAVTDKAYTSIVLLGYRRGVTPAEADARTLLSLMLLDRVLGEQEGRPRVVAELLDARDVELAMVTGGDDYVVSDALGALMMAQVAEHAALATVYDDLFAADGAAVHLAPASCYVPSGLRPYAEVVSAARARGEVALGYRETDELGDVPSLSGGIVVSPPKDRTVDLADADQVIVVRQG